MNLKDTEKTSLHSASLLVVDDDSLVLATLCMGLREVGFQVLEASSGEEAISLCEQHKIDLALLDIRLPGLSGIDTAKVILTEHHIPFLFLSAFNEDDIVNDAIKHGALGYLVKPVNINQIIPAIETALTRAADIQSLMTHQSNLNTALSQSRETSVAIGIFVAHTSLSPQQAESALRLYSRNTQQKMSNVAKSIIKASEELNTLINAIKTQVVTKSE
jgi:response regulator NasT